MSALSSPTLSFLPFSPVAGHSPFSPFSPLPSPAIFLLFCIGSLSLSATAYPLFPTIFFLSLSTTKPTNKHPKPSPETTQPILSDLPPIRSDPEAPPSQPPHKSLDQPLAHPTHLFCPETTAGIGLPNRVRWVGLGGPMGLAICEVVGVVAPPRSDDFCFKSGGSERIGGGSERMGWVVSGDGLGCLLVGFVAERERENGGEEWVCDGWKWRGEKGEWPATGEKGRREMGEKEELMWHPRQPILLT